MTEQSGFGRVSVITVTYNSAAFVADALRSAEEAAKRSRVDLEMIVVDNASSDQSRELVLECFPAARLIANEGNVGFASANNQAFRVAQGDVVLLLNPDAVLEDDALGYLLEFLRSHPTAGAVAPVVDSTWTAGPECAGMSPGIRSMMGHFLLVNRLLWRDRGGPWRGVMLQRRRHLGPRRVQWLGAAALLIRSEAFASVHGFDERYFLYSEDVDLGERLSHAGWELWLVPRARAVHLVAGGQERTSVRWVEAAHEHYARRSSSLTLVIHDLLMAVGLSARAIVWHLLRRSREGRGRAEMVASSARQAWLLTARSALRIARRDGP